MLYCIGIYSFFRELVDYTRGYFLSLTIQFDMALRHQRILLCHRHILKQSVIERVVLRRQKPGTVFRQKRCHQ